LPAGSLRGHMPLLRTMTVLLGLLVFISWGLDSASQYANRETLRPDDWQWAPAAAYRLVSPPDTGWTPYVTSSPLQQNSQTYWLKIPLNSRDVREPQLWILNAAAVAVYAGDDLLYEYDPDVSGHHVNKRYHWNLIPLPVPLPGDIDVLLEKRGSFRPTPQFELVNKGDLAITLIRKDLYVFVIGSLFLFCFFIALTLYIIRKDHLHLYFSLLALCGGYASFSRNYLMQLVWDQPWFSYVELAIFPVGVYWFISIMLEVFDGEHTRTLRIFGRIILGFAIVTLIGSFTLDAGSFEWLLGYPLLAMFLITASAIFRSIWSAYRHRKGTESIWMLAGFFIVSATALIHVMRTYLPLYYKWGHTYFPQLERLSFDILSVGLFLFLICVIRIIIYRFGKLNAQLEAFNQSLEDRVRTRTADLQERGRQLHEANTRLAHTAQETAEAIASSMVLEERSRVTGAIHDTIGHALTATIVQLEAAKRLLHRDPQLAEQKLFASQDLVRRGLEEIRLSVGMLRDDSPRYDLQAAMAALIRETEQSTGAVIEQSIGALPENLSTLQKKVLFQALQEGITNGLRHGGSGRFQFKLHTVRDAVEFSLISDGRTYTPSAFGFGLKAMSERAANLGGSMSVAPGNPGCVLALRLPVEIPLHDHAAPALQGRFQGD